jgi:hypothetical protein
MGADHKAVQHWHSWGIDILVAALARSKIMLSGALNGPIRLVMPGSREPRARGQAEFARAEAGGSASTPWLCAVSNAVDAGDKHRHHAGAPAICAGPRAWGGQSAAKPTTLPKSAQVMLAADQ